jgi:hypothetical protein
VLDAVTKNLAHEAFKNLNCEDLTWPCETPNDGSDEGGSAGSDGSDGSGTGGDAADTTQCDALKKTVAATGKITFLSDQIIE